MLEEVSDVEISRIFFENQPNSCIANILRRTGEKIKERLPKIDSKVQEDQIRGAICWGSDKAAREIWDVYRRYPKYKPENGYIQDVWTPES